MNCVGTAGSVVVGDGDVMSAGFGELMVGLGSASDWFRTVIEVSVISFRRVGTAHGLSYNRTNQI